MLSIITAIFNQKDMNELFWENLIKNTSNKFELIVIDNGSTDGSAEFFSSVGAKVVRNGMNYSYPYCQNRGIEVSQYDWLAFLNNDIIVSKNWDKHIIDSMLFNDLDVASACGIEQLESKKETRKLRRRWNKIKWIISVFGSSKIMLKIVYKIMYCNWANFCEQRFKKFEKKIKQGFVGNSIIMRRAALVKIGLWDERLQSADYDLYFRTVERFKNFGDIKPLHICLDTYVHHYIRLTAKKKYPPFVDRENLITIDQKWEPHMMEDYLKLIAE